MEGLPSEVSPSQRAKVRRREFKLSRDWRSVVGFVNARDLFTELSAEALMARPVHGDLTMQSPWE